MGGLTTRERAFAVALLISGTLITIGTAMLSVPATLIVVGIELAIASWLVLSE